MTANFSGSIVDAIETQNRFYGAQVGTAANVCLGCGVYLDGWAKIAIGDMHEGINLTGFTVSNGNIFSGGNLVGPEDNGRRRTFDRICAIPEVALNLGYQPCHWLRVYAGYTNFYVSTLARATNQTVTASSNTSVSINGTQVGSPVSGPAFSVHDTSLWVQGINFGLELRW